MVILSSTSVDSLSVKSTSSNLCAYVYYIVSNINNGWTVYCINTDLSKTYDTVNASQLSRKL